MMSDKKRTVSRMVVGFVFDQADAVFLIRKNRPKWQKGKLNGIGGHIEEGETPVEAMRREFIEEAGVDIKNWTHVAILEGYDWHLDVFTAMLPSSEHISSITDEIIADYCIYELHSENVIPNVRFLVPMCKEHLDNKYTFKHAYFKYMKEKTE